MNEMLKNSMYLDDDIDFKGSVDIGSMDLSN